MVTISPNDGIFVNVVLNDGTWIPISVKRTICDSFFQSVAPLGTTVGSFLQLGANESMSVFLKRYALVAFSASLPKHDVHLMARQHLIDGRYCCCLQVWSIKRIGVIRKKWLAVAAFPLYHGRFETTIGTVILIMLGNLFSCFVVNGGLAL